MTGEDKTFTEIKQEMCDLYGVTVRDFDSDRRTNYITSVRRITWWRAVQETDYSYTQLARWSGRKHHTTVMHAVALEDYIRGRWVKVPKCRALFEKRYGSPENARKRHDEPHKAQVVPQSVPSKGAVRPLVNVRTR